MAAWCGAAVLLALPAAAMRVAPNSGVDWSASDFAVMAAILLGTGLAIEGLFRISGSVTYRLGAALAVVTGMLLVWVNLAVGFLGDEDNPANLMFATVLFVALAGAVLARFSAGGMARAMIAAAASQVVVGAIGYVGGYAAPGTKGVYEVVMGTGLFTALWLAAAGLFHRAAPR
jgi:hypothetical protein